LRPLELALLETVGLGHTPLLPVPVAARLLIAVSDQATGLGRPSRPPFAFLRSSADDDLTEQSGNTRDHQKTDEEPGDRAIAQAIESLYPSA